MSLLLLFRSTAAGPLNLTATGGAATATGGTDTLTVALTATSGTATAAGGTVVASEGLTAATGAATATGTGPALTFAYTAASGAATAGGGDATASIFTPPVPDVTGAGRAHGTIRAVQPATPAVRRLPPVSLIVAASPRRSTSPSPRQPAPRQPPARQAPWRSRTRRARAPQQRPAARARVVGWPGRFRWGGDRRWYRFNADRDPRRVRGHGDSDRRGRHIRSTVGRCGCLRCRCGPSSGRSGHGGHVTEAAARIAGIRGNQFADPGARS
jgi:hypothetical protein